MMIANDNNYRVKDKGANKNAIEHGMENVFIFFLLNTNKAYYFTAYLT